jgi:hypothetical protein
MAAPQTKQELKKFRRVDVSVVTYLHAVSDGRLLKTVEQVFPIPLDKKLRTMLNWRVKDLGVSYETAMDFYLVEWFKALSEDKTVQQDMRTAYPDLPAFDVEFYSDKQLTWVPVKGV